MADSGRKAAPMAGHENEAGIARRIDKLALQFKDDPLNLELLHSIWVLSWERCCRIALMITGQPQDAEDAAVEALIKVWHKIDRWDPSLGTFWPWLRTLVRRESLNVCRGR